MSKSWSRAAGEATTLDELYMVRGMRESLSTNQARKVLECIKKGLNCPEDELPHMQKKSKSEANVDAIVDVLSGIARKVARENDIAPQTLAPHSELVALARGHWDECELMKGWRRHMLGEGLAAFMEGKCTLRIAEGNLEITRS